MAIFRAARANVDEAASQLSSKKKLVLMRRKMRTKTRKTNLLNSARKCTLTTSMPYLPVPKQMIVVIDSWIANVSLMLQWMPKSRRKCSRNATDETELQQRTH